MNALADPLRKYIHDLETECDPSGTIRENFRLREENKNLRIECTRLASTSDRNTVIEECAMAAEENGDLLEIHSQRIAAAIRALKTNPGNAAMTMTNLIWVGNTLLPRGLVYAIVGIIAAVVISAFVIATDKADVP